MFADDVLILLTSPLISAPNLINTLTKFGLISGLKRNPPHKSKALNISLPPNLQTQQQDSLPFTWLTKHIAYLGITFTVTPENLYTAPMRTQLTTLMKNWSFISLAWMGRITLVKMSILCKILYLFRVLSIQVPACFLRILQRKASQLIWFKLKPCLSQPTLYKSRICVGLSVPNFSKYYYAT